MPPTLQLGRDRPGARPRVPPVCLPAQHGTPDPSNSKAPRGRAAEGTGSTWTGAEEPREVLEPQGRQMGYVQGRVGGPLSKGPCWLLGATPPAGSPYWMGGMTACVLPQDGEALRGVSD